MKFKRITKIKGKFFGHYNRKDVGSECPFGWSSYFLVLKIKNINNFYTKDKKSSNLKIQLSSQIIDEKQLI